jgi:hypothetical protein
MTKDRKKVHEEAANYLKEKYCSYGEIWERKNGIKEFRLKKNVLCEGESTKKSKYSENENY